MSVQAPLGCAVCWLLLHPLQSSAPLAGAPLDVAAAEPLNATTAATTRRMPASATPTRRRGVARLISASQAVCPTDSSARPRPGSLVPPPGQHPLLRRRSY